MHNKILKNALVTGADGFIGSHLTELLLEKGYHVRALSYYNSFNYYWGWLEDIPENPNLEIVTGDVRDPHFIKQIIRDRSIVFHLSALIAIPYSYHAPDSYVDTNVKGTFNICQAAKELGGSGFSIPLLLKFMELRSTYQLMNTPQTTTVSLFCLKNTCRCHCNELLQCIWITCYNSEAV
jgi:dTDP-D-glucose 4,6-dehydratase